ncbi:hypothetical protein BH11BAC7_BH11BAC7_33010 [soil metagenome]
MKDLEKDLFIRSKRNILDFIFASIFVSAVFFFTPRANIIWPIGVIIILIIFYSYKVAYFCHDIILIHRPFLNFKKSINYRDLVSIDFSPQVLLSSSGIKLSYKSSTGKIKRVGFELNTVRFTELQDYLLTKNKKIIFSEY